MTEPLYLDVRVLAGQEFIESIPASHNAFIYVIHGPVIIANEAGEMVRPDRDDLGVLTQGNAVSLQAGENDAHFLLIAGKPLGEPVARAGPFVMNTRAEVQQAFEDFKLDRF
jgi:redox-sensitive bicupin YhaK (pirin superfamily)